jgi:uncharacterized SAM-binding protein YcdF (DUF218 family)
MFFELSKVLGFFASPSNLLIVMALVGVLLMSTRFTRSGRNLTAAGVVSIALFGFFPIGDALLLLLEERFPPWDAGRGAPDGIIVLGGAIHAERSEAAGRPVLNTSGERMTGAAELARRYPTARVVFTGGTGSLFGTAVEADHAAAAFESMGVARGRVVLEGRSRSTAENATYTAALVAPKPGERWLLVTSAWHMPRSVGAFRQAGFPVEAYPVDHRVLRRDLLLLSGSAAHGLGRADMALREWVGLIVYRFTGRSSALFPGPT